MLKRLQKIAKITSKNGVKFAFQMGLIKAERVLTRVLSPMVLSIAAHINWGTKNHKRILIVIEDKRSVSTLNRAYDLEEYLQLAGFKPTLVTTTFSSIELFRLKRYAAVVFQRCLNLPVIHTLVDKANNYGIATVYDCDDLIFAPEFTDKISDDFNTDSNWWHRISQKYKSVFDKCDYFLTSTEFLADIAKKQGKKAFVLRNGLNKQYEAFADMVHSSNQDDYSESYYEKLRRDGVPKDMKVVIGYQCGTSTHNNDFALVSDSILKLMRENENMFFEVFGYLNLPKEFSEREIKKRIIKQKFVQFKDLPNKLARFNINIAPAVVGNPFVEGKSELKYVYAAAMAIPTVASPTSSFKYAIIEGENGFLASNPDEWYTKLKKLADDYWLRKQIGENAYAHVMANYSPKAQSDNAKAIFDQIVGNK